MSEFVQITHDALPAGYIMVRKEVDLRTYISGLEGPHPAWQYRIIRVAGGHHDVYISVEDLREEIVEPIVKAAVQQIEGSPSVDPGSSGPDIVPFTSNEGVPDA